MVRTTSFAGIRAALRSQRTTVQRRFASSGTESAQKKAEDALSGAKESAQKVLDGAKKFGGSVGGRLGNMLGSYREPVFYNFTVTREFLKQVYIAERLQPPTSWATIQSAYCTLWARASNPTYWREVLSSGDWARLAIYGVEAYGIFKIGEIVGRRSLVGYKLN